MTEDNVLCNKWFLLGQTKNSSHARKTGSRYFLGILFKISDGHSRLFYMGIPPPLPPPSGTNQTN